MITNIEVFKIEILTDMGTTMDCDALGLCCTVMHYDDCWSTHCRAL